MKKIIHAALAAAYIAHVLMGCAPPAASARENPELNAANASQCHADESETACLSRHLSEERQRSAQLVSQYQRAFTLVQRHAAGEDVSAEAARLPAPTATPTRPTVTVRQPDPPRTGPAREPIWTARSTQSGSETVSIGMAGPALPMPPQIAPTGPANVWNQYLDALPARPSGAIAGIGFTGPSPFPADVPLITIYLIDVVDVAIDVDGHNIAITEDGGYTWPSIPLANGRRRYVSPCATHARREVRIALENPYEGANIRFRAYASNSMRPVGMCVGATEPRRVSLQTLGNTAINGYMFTERCNDP